jgi:hypothetical protein
MGCNCKSKEDVDIEDITFDKMEIKEKIKYFFIKSLVFIFISVFGLILSPVLSLVIYVMLIKSSVFDKESDLVKTLTFFKRKNITKEEKVLITEDVQ